MGRPTTKDELLKAAAENYAKLNELISSLTEEQLAASFDFSEDVKKCLDHGMNAHTSKPIDMDVLTRVLARFLPEKE